MCAPFFSCTRRLFSSFVLTCFLWTTLFQSFAFAAYDRAVPGQVILEREAGQLESLRLKIDIQHGDHAPLKTNPPHSDSDTKMPVYEDIRQRTADLFIPFGKTYE